MRKVSWVRNFVSKAMGGVQFQNSIHHGAIN